MEFSHALQKSLLAFGFVVLVLSLKALLDELILPRLSFSKTSALNLKQMVIRWVLFARRIDFSFKRDVLILLKISFLLTAIAVLPLNGESGLVVDRPDLAIAQLMAIFYFLRVFASWKSGDIDNWEKALEEMLFASSRVFVFLLIVDGAYLASGSGEFQRMIGKDFLILSGPFHVLAFLMGLLLVGFFQGREEYRLGGLTLFAWKAEALLWITLLLVTFLNTAAAPGPGYFFILAFKCIAIVFTLDLVRSHLPKVRMDQLERVGLTVVYPIAVLIFLGMWWQETLK